MDQSYQEPSLRQLLEVYAVRHRVQSLRLAAAQRDVLSAERRLSMHTAETTQRGIELREAYTICRKVVGNSPRSFEVYERAAVRAREHYRISLNHESATLANLQVLKGQCLPIRFELIKIDVLIEEVHCKLKVIRLKALELQDAPLSE